MASRCAVSILSRHPGSPSAPAASRRPRSGIAPHGASGGTRDRDPAARDAGRASQLARPVAQETLAQQAVDSATGLTTAEVEKRRGTYGSNKFAEAEKE